MSADPGGSDWEKQVARLVARDGPLCHYCKIWMVKDNTTRDHIWPRSRGGTWNDNNLVLACVDCNSRWGKKIWKCVCPVCWWATNYYRIH